MKKLREIVDKPLKEGLGAHLNAHKGAYIGGALGSFFGLPGTFVGAGVGAAIDKHQADKKTKPKKSKRSTFISTTAALNKAKTIGLEPSKH